MAGGSLADLNYYRVQAPPSRLASLQGESPDPALKECPSGFTRRAALWQWSSTYRRSDSPVQGDSLKKLMLAGLVAVLGLAPTFAVAEVQGEKKMMVGRVQSVDETGTEITLTDGTRLLTPPGSIVRPGAFEEGTEVIAMYREENGDKILTNLTLGQIEPPAFQRPASRRSGNDSDGERKACGRIVGRMMRPARSI